MTGSPKVYPQYGDIAGSWAMGNCDANEYIEVRARPYISLFLIKSLFTDGVLARLRVLLKYIQITGTRLAPGRQGE